MSQRAIVPSDMDTGEKTAAAVTRYLVAEDQAPAITLRSAQFRENREHTWRKLDELVSLVEKKGISSLTAEEVQDLPMLYRGTVSALSVARGIVLDRNLLLYLENLSLRAYLVVYGPRSSVFTNFASFFTEGFPKAVRGVGKHLGIAFLVFLAGVIGGYVMTIVDPEYFNVLVPDGLSGGRGPGSTREELIRSELFAPWPGFLNSFVVFASSLFRHNTMVGILSFGLGFVLGIPSVLLMLYNGAILGAFAAIHARHGLLIDFLGWVSIHGVTEILAILLCAAAGLAIAEKIVFPGQLPRLESLAKYGQKAASVAAGTVLLFLVAGILEGGFRQLISNTTGRFAVAMLTAGIWLYYFTFAGKKNVSAK